MASITKRGKSFRIKFLNPKTRKQESITVLFTGNTSETLRLAKAQKADIEHRIALHKSGLQLFIFEEKCDDISEITLGDFLTLIENDQFRKREVDERTFRANTDAIKNLIAILGYELRLKELAEEPKYINQFKQARFTYRVQACEDNGLSVDEDKIKRGINNNIKDLSAIFNYAVKAGHIPEHFIPRFKKFKVVKSKTFAILDESEMVKIMQVLDKSQGKSEKTLEKGDAWLAYLIYRETGARRGSIVRKSLNHDNGLKWLHINWMQNTMTLTSKGKEYAVPMTEQLRQVLLRRKQEIGCHWQPGAHVIQFTKDTITHNFRRAMKKAGVDKPGAVHILRHTLPVDLLEAGANIADVKEWLNHADLSTTNIYTHIRNERLQKVAKLRSKSV